MVKSPALDSNPTSAVASPMSGRVPAAQITFSPGFTGFRAASAPLPDPGSVPASPCTSSSTGSVSASPCDMDHVPGSIPASPVLPLGPVTSTVLSSVLAFSATPPIPGSAVTSLFLALLISEAGTVRVGAVSSLRIEAFSGSLTT